jgi:hypothetical protein
MLVESSSKMDVFLAVITGAKSFENEAEHTDPDEYIKQIKAEVEADLDKPYTGPDAPTQLMLI